ncbi:MAG: type II toxin-antitoxin system PemK/MazF family toxin [Candidatus Melainabacteria bacterium]|nr:type II toxin-antitoxin system PemK/MazF family toxin [Candidatus Melainabacteria bacterium]
MTKPLLLHRPKRGEVWIVELDPTRGHEMQKTRYCLVIQSDVLNKKLPTFIISPITSKVREEWYPIGIILKKGEGDLMKESQVMLNQVKAADITRFKKKIGKVSENIMKQVNHSLTFVLGLE